MEITHDFTKVDEILTSYGMQQAYLIAIMQDIQTEYHYLPKEILEYISEKLELSIAKVYSVATFYENFSLEPKGKYILRICDGTACHVRKSIPILERLRKELNLSAHKTTTDDMLFTLETVSCLGACGLAPVMTLNDTVHPAMTPDKAMELLTSIRENDSVDSLETASSSNDMKETGGKNNE
ncbi:NADH-quinone oxidoreductase subunit NuoE family protein [Anaeromicropila herbilytica]|uniref:NADH dehydrogenase n=1 Tax=Anaeromicropila herbilytica TaxID=2785025 RepID=A0A7R7IFB6_9FIRM|nr:NAD(P)H-dependent oxidoreductase subunit E [Anaeromicropila herbilytica]BCN31973.1 NADH dehydrogenase [Anaeromicropila herbilytica]